MIEGTHIRKMRKLREKKIFYIVFNYYYIEFNYLLFIDLLISSPNIEVKARALE